MKKQTNVDFFFSFLVLILPIFSLQKSFYYSIISSLFWILNFISSSLIVVLLSTKINLFKDFLEKYALINTFLCSIFYFLFSLFYPIDASKDDIFIVFFSLPLSVFFAIQLNLKEIFRVSIFFKKTLKLVYYFLLYIFSFLFTEAFAFSKITFFKSKSLEESSLNLGFLNGGFEIIANPFVYLLIVIYFLVFLNFFILKKDK